MRTCSDGLTSPTQRASRNTKAHLAVPSDLWSKEVEMSVGQLPLRRHSLLSAMFENFDKFDVIGNDVIWEM